MLITSNLRERAHLGDLDIDGLVRITLERFFKKQSVRIRTEFIWLRLGMAGGLL
jgi:hypothetical protein